MKAPLRIFTVFLSSRNSTIPTRVALSSITGRTKVRVELSGFFPGARLRNRNRPVKSAGLSSTVCPSSVSMEVMPARFSRPFAVTQMFWSGDRRYTLLISVLDSIFSRRSSTTRLSLPFSPVLKATRFFWLTMSSDSPSSSSISISPACSTCWRASQACLSSRCRISASIRLVPRRTHSRNTSRQPASRSSSFRNTRTFRRIFTRRFLIVLRTPPLVVFAPAPVAAGCRFRPNPRGFRYAPGFSPRFPPL